MADGPTSTERQPQASKSFVKIVFLTGWALMMLAMLSVFAGNVYYLLAYPGSQLPPPLGDWGSMVLGFFFGSFTGLLKDYMGFDR